MMNMMYSTGTGLGSGFIFLWGLHVLSVIAFFIGVLFLVSWAMKTLNHGQLKTWGIGLILGATIACLITIGAGGMPWNNYYVGNTGYARMMRFSNTTLPTGMMQNGMGMSMMLRGRTGDDFDQAFLALMVPHHQDAINMANDALKNAKHDEIKQLARDIITAQQKEIDMMHAWEKDWGYAQ